MNNVQGVKNEFLGKYQEGQHHLILNSLNTEKKNKKRHMLDHYMTGIENWKTKEIIRKFVYKIVLKILISL